MTRQATLDGAGGDLSEVDASVFRDEQFVAFQRDGHASGAAHPSDVPVVEESEFVARRLHCDQVGSIAVLGDAPEVGEGRPQRPGANVHGPPVMIQPSSTRLARPRDAGKWLDPATRGPTHSGSKTSSSTRAPVPARIQSVEAPPQTAPPADPSHFETSITTSSCSLTESSAPPNSAGLAMLKAPVASRSAMVSSRVG